MSARRLLIALLFLITSTPLLVGEAVLESRRDIPIAYEVDVVVVGGGTGAVSAAVTAAEQGVKVFLAAPYPYLGEDMTATLRLWLEPGESPKDELAKRIFADKVAGESLPHPDRIAFSYEADKPSVGKHKDTSPPSVLCDGAWGGAVDQSVQYDGSVNIIADLKQPSGLSEVRLVFHHRAKSRRAENFKVKSYTVLGSSDNKKWEPLGKMFNLRLQREEGHELNEPPNGKTITLSVPSDSKSVFRYVKLQIEKTDNVDRILLGEIEIIGPSRVSTPKPARLPPRPMHVKRVLDQALLDAGVKFLYSSYPTDVLRDADGKPCGIVMANRAGRQAVIAKTIIDATENATVARLAGAKFRPYPTGPQAFKYTVIGGKLQTGEGMTGRTVGRPFKGDFPNRAKTPSGLFAIHEYSLKLKLKDNSPASMAATEQTVRSMTYAPGQQFTADRLFWIAPHSVYGSAAKAPGCYRPRGIERIWILGGCADVSREEAEKLTRPLALMETGQMIGLAVASQAKASDKPQGVHLPGGEMEGAPIPGTVCEPLAGVRPVEKRPTIKQQPRPLPVLGEYDVVVIGGGTAGAPAGIAAARQGAKTLVVEYLHGLGGVGTQGAIAKYYWGNRVGFTASVPGKVGWVIEDKMQWYRQELLKAGADIWFGTIGCGALVNDGRVTGAVIATPQGRGVVLAKVVIDATGNSDVAAAAGAKCLYTDETEFGMQGTGLPGRKLGGTYNNTDFTIVDETDMADVWRMFVFSKDKYPDAFDQGRLIDTRERRRIVGGYTVNILDQVNARTFPDSVVRTHSDFDSHGYTIDPYCNIEHPGRGGFYTYIPYRCMLPMGLDGILVAGLGISAHRDAVPMIRMQPDIQNGGYAAGVAAAMAVKANVQPRGIDVRALQKHLVEVGNLPKSVLTDEDSYPMSDERIAAAIEAIGQGKKGVAVVLAFPKRALPPLKNAFEKSQGKSRLVYARLLATMGDSTGLDVLLDELKKHKEWDRGWNYRGMGQYGNALSPQDVLIVSAGYTRNERALPVIFEKMKTLTAAHDFSHLRAVSMALAEIGSPTAAKPLAELLSKPGMTGYVQDSIEVASRVGTPGGTKACGQRRDSIAELLLARALYRCGDFRGLGKRTLQAYTKDLRGHLARHAKAVLEAGVDKP